MPPVEEQFVVDESFGRLTVAAFLERLGSEAPTPGGGSVAALCGAMAAALGRMACVLTLGRAKFAAVQPQVRVAMERLERAGAMLQRLMDEDAAAYEQLSAALKRPKSDAGRADEVRAAATLAAEVPLETATLCGRVHAELTQLLNTANPNLHSDVEAGTHLADAALRAAAANVRVNLGLMDPQAAAEIERQLAPLLGRPTSAGG